TTSSLSAGMHTVTAVYGGDSNFLSSTTSALTETVNNATVTTVASSPNPSLSGQAVTFTATVTDTSGSATPTGSVEFYDGSTDLGAGSALSGSDSSAISTFTLATLTVGSHTVKAVYTPS